MNWSSGQDGHDLHLLYLKTTPDFKEKLQVSYNQFISETKNPIETDIENLLRRYKKTV